MPKNEDKIKQHRQRMAQFEKPLNQIDFARGEKPQQQRLEEEYMTKYFEMKPPKIQQKTDANSDAGGSDAELDEFADKVIEDKMREIQKTQGVNPDESDESLDIKYSDDDDSMQGNSEEGEDDFFGGEDSLSDVDIGGEQEELEGDEDSEMPPDSEDSEEDEYGEELHQEEVTKKDVKNQPKKKKVGKHVYAAYEEFAHMLSDSEDENASKHIDAKLSGVKRSHFERQMHLQKGGRRGRPQNHKRQRR